MHERELNKSRSLTELRGVLAIPARLKSTRLPRKLLLHDTGQALLAHVIENAQQVVCSLGKLFSGIVVVCDGEELAGIARQANVNVILASGKHSCGTSRIAAALPQIQYEFGQVDFVLNWQADQVLVHGEAIQSCVEALLHSADTEMATIAVSRFNEDLLKTDSSTVKVSVDENGWATDFRRDHPSVDSGQRDTWCQHVGLYAYRTGLLRAYPEIPPSPRETNEQLEQLRFLKAGYRIRVALVPEKSPGQSINVRKDYDAFIETLNMS